MNQEKYPEKVYASFIQEKCHEKRFVGGWSSRRTGPKEQDNVEYTRSDIVPRWHSKEKLIQAMMVPSLNHIAQTSEGMTFFIKDLDVEGDKVSVEDGNGDWHSDVVAILPLKKFKED